MSATETNAGKYAYATLITRASYLAGVVILAHTLRRHQSRYPLVVFYTPNLAASPALRALQLQAGRLSLVLHECELLLPPKHVQVHLIAERFGDTWTKLRLFGDQVVWQFDAVCYLDADMAIFNGNMDDVFSLLDDLPTDCIAANHACVCNLDGDLWAPEEWRKENCAYTPQSHPSALEAGTEVRPDSRPTYHLLNSGMFLYRPTPDLWASMLLFFNTTDKLGTFKFPDQDFLAEFFKNRWRSVGWQWNGLKTMRYWHENIWRDASVRCLHYIVDKPWASTVTADGVAGYKGRDGDTHRWWWVAFSEWVADCRSIGEDEAVAIVQNHIANNEGEPDDPDMQAIGSGVQAYAKRNPPANK